MGPRDLGACAAIMRFWGAESFSKPKNVENSCGKRSKTLTDHVTIFNKWSIQNIMIGLRVKFLILDVFFRLLLFGKLKFRTVWRGLINFAPLSKISCQTSSWNNHLEVINEKCPGISQKVSKFEYLLGKYASKTFMQIGKMKFLKFTNFSY